jgi:adenylate cyclase class 2
MDKNHVETELKFLLKGDLQEFLKKFIGSKKRIYQKTVMFDNNEGLMQKTNGRIRLRQDNELITLSYKLPISSKIVKKEIELETKVDSWLVGEELLKVMGFKETTSYEKYRTTLFYEGVKIDVDEYPFSTFVEIEGAEEVVKSIALKLGFDLSSAIIKPCDTLFNEWRTEKGLPLSLHMKFDDYDK